MSDDSPLPSDILKQSNGDPISFGSFFLEYGSPAVDLATLFRFRGIHEQCPVGGDGKGFVGILITITIRSHLSYVGSVHCTGTSRD